MSPRQLYYFNHFLTRILEADSICQLGRDSCSFLAEVLWHANFGVEIGFFRVLDLPVLFERLSQARLLCLKDWNIEKMVRIFWDCSDQWEILTFPVVVGVALRRSAFRSHLLHHNSCVHRHLRSFRWRHSLVDVTIVDTVRTASSKRHIFPFHRWACAKPQSSHLGAEVLENDNIICEWRFVP